MANYASIQNNNFGLFTDNPKQFLPLIDLTCNLVRTVGFSPKVLALPAGSIPGPATLVSLDAVTNAKFLVIQSDQAISVTITGSLGSQNVVPCDPILILTNQSQLGSIAALSIARATGLLTNVSISAWQ